MDRIPDSTSRSHARRFSPERVVYRGRIFEVVEVDVDEGGHQTTFEKVRRAPGTRIIVRDADGMILLTREWRHELRREDLRLPGGKVFDTLQEYEQNGGGNTGHIEVVAKAARRELREETGIEASSLDFVARSVCGATVDWDLYYFEAVDWKRVSDGQVLEPGEEITVTWMSRQETIDACLKGDISEERTALVLLRFLASPGDARR